jgi:hypothetical protein
MDGWLGFLGHGLAFFFSYNTPSCLHESHMTNLFTLLHVLFHLTQLLISLTATPESVHVTLNTHRLPGILRSFGSLEINSAMAWIRASSPLSGSSDALRPAAIVTVFTIEPALAGPCSGAPASVPTTRPFSDALLVYDPTSTAPAGFHGSTTALDWLEGTQITTDGGMGVNNLNDLNDMNDIVMDNDFEFNS